MRASLLDAPSPEEYLLLTTAADGATWRSPALRALLQANQAPPVGGFQAARYFTYVFFALAISVVMVMIFLCSMHCYRRAQRQRQLELRRMRSPASLPEVNIQINNPRAQPAPAPKALPVYEAVLVRHPDGSKEVAYAPELPARMLEPELSAAQKAALRRLGRAHSSAGRFEDGDPRSRRRRALQEATAGAERHGSTAGQREQRHRRERGGGSGGGVSGRGASRHSFRSARQPGEGALQEHEQQLSASLSGRIQPFFADRDRASGARAHPAAAAAPLGAGTASSDSDSDWDLGAATAGARLPRQPSAGARAGGSRQPRRQHSGSGGGSGGASGRQHTRRHSDSPVVYGGGSAIYQL